MAVPQPTWVSDLETKRPILCAGGGSPAPEEMAPPPSTLPPLLAGAAESRGESPMFVSAEGDVFSASRFYLLARRVAKALLAMGVQPHEGVTVLGENSVQWFAADWGAVLAGALPAPSYVTNSPEVLAYIFDRAAAAACFVNDENDLAKAVAARALASSGSIKCIVVWGDGVNLERFKEDADCILTWDDFLATGDRIPDADVDARMALARPEDCAKLIFTSGTTGPPKAVMVSHDNLIFMGHCVVRDYKITDADTSVSYLPASHIAANVMDCVGPVFCGVVVHLARPGALRGTLVDSLKAVRPTTFYAVPRVWEKIHERMLAMRANMGPVKLFISSTARSIGAAASDAEDAGRRLPLGTRLCGLLVFSGVRAALGLDRARVIFNTAAPLQKGTSDYFRSLRIRINDVYGMSEGAGSFTVSNYENYRKGSVGRVSHGVEVKLDKKDPETGEGELCFRARNVFRGYLGDDEESAKAIDEEGFVHSGDLAKIDEDGFVFITGRAKELIITSGGENVAPVAIEVALRDAMPAISRAFAVGDARKYVCCLVVPQMNPDGSLVGPAKSVSPDVTHASGIAGDSAWAEYIEAGVAKANESAISNVAKVKKFHVLATDFTVDPRPGFEKGELTPTMKVRRKVVLQNFSKEIEQMYT